MWSKRDTDALNKIYLKKKIQILCARQGVKKIYVRLTIKNYLKIIINASNLNSENRTDSNHRENTLLIDRIGK